MGSSPTFSTTRPGRLVVRTPGFHPGNRGSIPRRATKGSVVQLDRMADFGSAGWGFESLRGHKYNNMEIIALIVLIGMF